MQREPWRAEKERLVKRYHEQNKKAKKGGVVFAGSSLMEQFPLEKLAAELGSDHPLVYNRGVGGYTTRDLLPILDICVWELAPRKVFINIGTNDLSDINTTIEEMIGRYDEILARIESHLPGVPIYLMAYYPVNYEAATEQMKQNLKTRTNEKINRANAEVEKLAARRGLRYIDINAPLKDEQGRLKAEYTVEGMHIKEAGYRSIFPKLMEYVLE